MLGDVRVGLSADALPPLAVVDQADQRRLDLVRRTRVDAGDAVLDVGIDVGMRDQRDAERARLEPAQVALAAEQVVLGGRAIAMSNSVIDAG